MCRIKNLLQSRESRERLGQAETRKMAPRREQSCGLESRLQPLCSTVKLGNKECFDKELIGIKEPFPVTNLPFTSYE